MKRCDDCGEFTDADGIPGEDASVGYRGETILCDVCYLKRRGFTAGIRSYFEERGEYGTMATKKKGWTPLTLWNEKDAEYADREAKLVAYLEVAGVEKPALQTVLAMLSEMRQQYRTALSESGASLRKAA